MKKTNVIVASILGILVVIISVILFMRPFVLKNNSKKNEKVEEKLPEKEENDEDLVEKNIQLGVNILFSGSGITIGEGSLITIKNGGIYNITGNLTSGKIIVEAHEKVILNFQGVNITSDDTVLDIKNEKETVINLENSSYNYFTSNSSSAINASGNLKITGSGTLNVLANNGNAITSSALTIENGNIYLTCRQVPIQTKENYSILDGLVLALGNSNLENISDNTKITTVVFKLPQRINNTDILTLVDSDGNDIINIKTLLDIDTIIIANSSINNNSYNLIKDYGNTNEKIIIQDQDTFKVEKNVNYFK